MWADIADKFAQLRTSSPTGAMEALFLQHASFIDDCAAAGAAKARSAIADALMPPMCLMIPSFVLELSLIDAFTR